jgi:hypothetical protein
MLLSFTALLIALACNTVTGRPPAPSSPQAVIIEKDVVYGPGPFDLPNPKVGLSDLTSYEATLVLSFDGTRDGQPEKWSQTYVMRKQTEPAARQLTIEKTGDLSDPDPVFMAEEGGTEFERIGEAACSAAPMETGNALSDRAEPAGLLNYVLGADEAGSETVNDIPSTHYTFDQQALGQQGVTESTGEMWIASEGGYIVKYVLTTRGKAVYFGEGTEGALSFDYQLTAVNQTVEINIPVDCPPGLVDAPQLPDASNIAGNLGVLMYQTSSSVQDAAAFYQRELPPLGWQPVGEPSISEESALLVYSKARQTMSVSITLENGITTVQIALSRAQK